MIWESSLWEGLLNGGCEAGDERRGLIAEMAGMESQCQLSWAGSCGRGRDDRNWRARSKARISECDECDEVRE